MHVFCNIDRTLTTNASIWTAAELGDVARVRVSVAVKGRRPDSLDPHGYSPLHLAAQSELQQDRATRIRAAAGSVHALTIPCVPMLNAKELLLSSLLVGTAPKRLGAFNRRPKGQLDGFNRGEGCHTPKPSTTLGPTAFMTGYRHGFSTALALPSSPQNSFGHEETRNIV